MNQSQDGRRSRRVAELARTEFTRAVQRRIDDPRLRSVFVVNADVSPDLSVVDLGVRFTGVASGEEQQKLVKKLTRALPRLVREIIPRLELRRVPSIRLHYDAGEDATQRVEELLREIEDERDKSRD
jgi:ribosome-binding factor A